MENMPGQVVRKPGFLHHGESVCNKNDRFCGWTDVDLSSRGKDVRRNPGRELKKHGSSFDVAFTSILTRATGIPLVFELDGDLQLFCHYYFGDAALVQAAMEAVRHQVQYEKADRRGEYSTEKERT